jgi:VWFA-related protein
MKRGISRWEVPLAVLAAATLLLPTAAQQPFSSNTNLVVVPVVAVDNKGKPVMGLQQSDFEVLEDGKPVEVQTFVAPAPSGVTGEAGRFLVVVLDNILTRTEFAFRIKAIAHRLVDRLGPADVMTIIPLNGGNAVTTTSKVALKAAVDRFTPRFGDDTWAYSDKADHGLRMLSSVSEQAAKVAHQRKVVVFIGNAALFTPSRASAFDDRGNDMSPEWSAAVRATSRNNLSMYSINPEGAGGDYGEWSHSFMAETGGYAWSATNNYSGAVDQIFQESASYYLIGYSAPTSDQRLHRIEVKVSKKGVTVRARRSRG